MFDIRTLSPISKFAFFELFYCKGLQGATASASSMWNVLFSSLSLTLTKSTPMLLFIVISRASRSFECNYCICNITFFKKIVQNGSQSSNATFCRGAFTFTAWMINCNVFLLTKLFDPSSKLGTLICPTFERNFPGSMLNLLHKASRQFSKFLIRLVERGQFLKNKQRW